MKNKFKIPIATKVGFSLFLVSLTGIFISPLFAIIPGIIFFALLLMAFIDVGRYYESFQKRPSTGSLLHGGLPRDLAFGPNPNPKNGTSLPIKLLAGFIALCALILIGAAIAAR